MFIEKLIIINYQSCQNLELEFIKDEPTIIIGINDSGKSTILKAIDLLFDGKTTFNFLKEDRIRNDISNTQLPEEIVKNIFINNDLPPYNYKSDQALIIGKVKVESDDLLSGFENHLSNQLIWALENATDNIIWIMKVFDGSDSSINDYLLVFDSKKVPKNLWKLNTTELKKERANNKISEEDIENENKAGRFKNIEQIRAIYSKLYLIHYWAEYKDKKKDKSFFPEISYLDWNFSFEELITFTNSIMNQSISSNLKKVKKIANAEAKKAQKIINTDLKEITSFLSGEINTITKVKSNIYFNVQSKITDLVLNKINTDSDIHLDSQGDGIKRQIWFALIKWKAKKSLENIKTNKKLIWCFDEPETHLYPAAQRDFFNKIRIVSNNNVQAIISTHSTIFVDKANLPQINKTLLLNGYSSISKCNSVDEVFDSLNIKNSDFLFFDKFLVIEGETEKYLIPYLFKLVTNKKLENYNIQMIILKGKDKWLYSKRALESVFADFKKPEESVYYLFDADMKFELGSDAIKSNMYFIGKQDIEDSITFNVWKSIVKEVTKDLIDLNKKDFNRIIKGIHDDRKIPKADKFLPQLEKFLKTSLSQIKNEPITWDIIPSKGHKLADIIVHHLKSTKDISKVFSDVFKSLVS